MVLEHCSLPHVNSPLTKVNRQSPIVNRQTPVFGAQSRDKKYSYGRLVENKEHCYASNTTHRATNTGQVIQTYSLEQKIQLWLIGEEIGQRTKDKGQRIKEQGTRNKEQGTRNKEQGTRNKRYEK